MSRTYVIGDLHWGHRNILKYRDIGASTTEEHDLIMLDNVLHTTGKRDTLILNGDICFSVESVDLLIELSKHVRLIKWSLGNHDSAQAVRKAIQHIENLSVLGTFSHKGCWVGHFPIHEDEFYNKKVNIHGHLHTKVIHDERYFNSSADNTKFAPVDIQDILGGYRGELYPPY